MAYKRTSLVGKRGGSRSLDFPDRAELWGKWCEGANVFDLAVQFETSPAEIEAAISVTAVELGYPHNHIDPELERFRILEANDRVKSFLIKNLKDSERILAKLNLELRLLQSGEEPEQDSAASTPAEPSKLQGDQRAAYLTFLEVRRAELKTAAALLVEYRATNDQNAQLTGIKRSKPVREPKKIVTDEERLEVLDDAKLREMLEDENPTSN